MNVNDETKQIEIENLQKQIRELDQEIKQLQDERGRLENDLWWLTSSWNNDGLPDPNEVTE